MVVEKIKINKKIPDKNKCYKEQKGDMTERIW